MFHAHCCAQTSTSSGCDLGAREVPQDLIEIEVAVDEQRAVDAEEDDGGDDAGEDEVAPADAALVVRAMAPVAVHEDRPREDAADDDEQHRHHDGGDVEEGVVAEAVESRRRAGAAAGARASSSRVLPRSPLECYNGGCASVLPCSRSQRWPAARRWPESTRATPPSARRSPRSSAYDEPRAEALYREVLALGLDWSPVWNNLAVIEVHRHDYSTARKLLAHAVAANERDVVALTNYGVISYHLSDYVEARRTLEAGAAPARAAHRQHPVDGARVVGRGAVRARDPAARRDGAALPGAHRVGRRSRTRRCPPPIWSPTCASCSWVGRAPASDAPWAPFWGAVEKRRSPASDRNPHPAPPRRISAIDKSAAMSSTLNSMPPLPPPKTNQPACGCTQHDADGELGGEPQARAGRPKKPAASATVPATSTSDSIHAIIARERHVMAGEEVAEAADVVPVHARRAVDAQQRRHGDAQQQIAGARRVPITCRHRTLGNQPGVAPQRRAAVDLQGRAGHERRRRRRQVDDGVRHLLDGADALLRRARHRRRRRAPADTARCPTTG